MADENDTPAADSADDIGMGADIMDAVSDRLTGGAGPKFSEAKPADDQGDDDKGGGADDQGNDGDQGAGDQGGADDQGDDDGQDDGADNKNGADDDQGDDDKDKSDTPQLSAELQEAIEALPEESRETVTAAFTAELGKVKGETNRLGQRVEQLTAEIETERKRQGPVQVADVPAALLMETAEQIDEYEQKLDDDLQKFIDWADDNAAGVNLPDSENYDETKPTFTAEQIRARRRELERATKQEKTKLLKQARENVVERKKLNDGLRALYPAAFDPKSDEYAAIENVLTAMPQLRQFPDARIIGLRQFLGARELAKLINQRKEQGPQGKKPAGKDKAQPQENKAKKPVPRAPGNGRPAKGSVLQQQRNRPAASEAVNKVYQDPSDKKAFTAAVAGILD